MESFELKSYVGTLALLLCSASMYAQQRGPAEDPQVLVREVIANELQAQQSDQNPLDVCFAGAAPGK
jgi:hypothetical protein